MLRCLGVSWVRVHSLKGPLDVFNTHLHANYSHKAKSTKINGQIKVSKEFNAHAA